MSQETIESLQSNVLVGDTSKHGNPWHSTEVESTEDSSTNLYPNAVPVGRVRTLFDFPVVKAPVSYGLPDGRVITSDRVAIAHGDTGHLFGIFASSYEIHPYGEALLDNLSKIVGESDGDLHIDSAGLLSKGGEAWVSISAENVLSTPEGVDYWPHILAATSHMGTLSTTYKAVNTMVVCDNTRAMALSEKTPQFKIKHTRYSQTRMNSARDALGLIDLTSDGFAAEVKLLCEQTVTDSQWSEFVKMLAPIEDGDGKNKMTRAENMRETLTTLYVGDPRCEPWHGTAFGALQAVNVFDLWERGTKGDTIAADRVVREALTGTLDTREVARATMLGNILANV